MRQEVSAGGAWEGRHKRGGMVARTTGLGAPGASRAAMKIVT